LWCFASHDLTNLPTKYSNRKLLPGSALLTDTEVIAINNPVMSPLFAGVIVRYFAVLSHLLTQEHHMLEIFYSEKYNMATILHQGTSGRGVL